MNPKNTLKTWAPIWASSYLTLYSSLSTKWNLGGGQIECWSILFNCVCMVYEARYKWSNHMNFGRK